MLAAPATLQVAPLTAASFLKLLAEPNRSEFAAEQVAIVLAHPDDETIGCGAQLSRLAGATLVIVTDGAPRRIGDAQANGFRSEADYAAARAAELDEALTAAGAATSLVRLGIADQQASFRLIEITRALIALFRNQNIRVALTHAYEGGHPDHDATAFAVHAAAMGLRKAGQPPQIVEMPYYRAHREHWLVQSFAPGPSKPLELPLTPREHAIKERMYAAHATQRRTLAMFATDVECYRAAPAYDFTQLPNGGDCLYDRHDWGLRSGQWPALAGAALYALGAGA